MMKKTCSAWDLNPEPLAHKTNAITNLASRTPIFHSESYAENLN